MSVGGLPWHPFAVKRIAVTLAVGAIAVAACGEAGPLDGVGDRTREIVRGPTTTTSTVVAVAAGLDDEALVAARDVLWFNDDIDPQYTGEPDDVIGEIWRRQLRSRFVQSARREIAAALPTVSFPSLVPEQVQWVTSQLVYVPTTGTLDPDTSAAFGLWMAEPYKSDIDRLAVLRVGRAPTEAISGRSPIAVTDVPDGVSLEWTESGHRYELYCRALVSEELCLAVAQSTVPLAALLP